MNDRIIYYGIASILLILSGFVVYRTLTTDPLTEIDSSAQSNELSEEDRIAQQAQSLPVLTIKDVPVRVEIVDDNESRARGLSGRDSLADDQGMLFVYDISNIPAFWMHDMKFDLDMIWINNDSVVDITENVPAPKPGTPDSELPKYSPSQSVNAILEVNAGFAERNNIQIGDPVVFPDELEN